MNNTNIIDRNAGGQECCLIPGLDYGTVNNSHEGQQIDASFDYNRLLGLRPSYLSVGATFDSRAAACQSR